MSYMFYNCTSLKDLNINNFRTDNVTDMSYSSMDVVHQKN